MIYTLGLVASSHPFPTALMVLKGRGTKHAGLWNLPGGKFEKDDASINHTMSRELQEEAGLSIPPHAWSVRGLFQYDDGVMVLMLARPTEMKYVKTNQGLPHMWMRLDRLITAEPDGTIVPGVSWKAAMCFDDGAPFVDMRFRHSANYRYGVIGIPILEDAHATD